MEEARLKNIPSKVRCFLRICSLVQFHQWERLGNNITPTREELGKNTTPINGRTSASDLQTDPAGGDQTLKLHHV